MYFFKIILFFCFFLNWPFLSNNNRIITLIDPPDNRLPSNTKRAYHLVNLYKNVCDSIVIENPIVWSFAITEMYRINREDYRYLCDEARNQQHFVAFVLPSSGFIWQMHKTAFSEIARWSHSMAGQMQQNAVDFWPQPPSCCLDIYSTLYFFIYLCAVYTCWHWMSDCRSVVKHAQYLLWDCANAVFKWIRVWQAKDDMGKRSNGEVSVGEKERKREGENVCVGVCVCVCLFVFVF